MKKTFLGTLLAILVSTSVATAYSCISVYEPVCGTDGNTYQNECMLGAVNRESGENTVQVAYEGECVTTTCTSEYNPVCGVDGNTYSNRCVAEQQNNINVDYEGACITIPANCTRRYDGCNECGVENGNITYCTERACIHQDTPRCLEYEAALPNIPDGCVLRHDGCNECQINQYGELTNCSKRYCANYGTKICLKYAGVSQYTFLNTNGMDRIDEVFSIFMSKISIYNRHVVLESLAEKLNLLIAEKKVFLSVSRMSQVSYEKTQFIIEVYQYLLFLIEEII